jgi:hypothetical protein
MLNHSSAKSLKYACVFLLALWIFNAAPMRGQAPPECSLVKTNRSCTYTLDRSLPLTPPTLQMYSGQTITIAIKNGYSFERYSLDLSAGSVNPAPDIGSNIFTALQPSLKNVGEIHESFERMMLYAVPDVKCDVTTATADSALPATDDDSIKAKRKSIMGLVSACLAELDSEQVDTTLVYHQIQAAIWPDSRSIKPASGVTEIGLPPVAGTGDVLWETAIACELFGKRAFVDGNNDPLKNAAGDPVMDSDGNPIVCKMKLPLRADLYQRIAEESSTISSILAAFKFPAGAPSVGAVAGAPAVPTIDAGSWAALQLLSDSKTTLDAARTDLSSFGFRIVSLIKNPVPVATQIGIIPKVKSTSTLIPSVTYNVNVLNLILTPDTTTDSSKKKSVVAITAVYGDAKWEVSAGTFFSSLASRSFTADPQFTLGNPDVVTDKKVKQSILRPTVVPFAAVSRRLSNDWTKPRWRTNIFWTGAVGVNTNTVSTDFATGPSISYRLLMFSGFWHIGHDTRLTQGVKVGDSLGAGFNGSLPTETYWRFDSFALGISIRVPSLTGR